MKRLFLFSFVAFISISTSAVNANDMDDLNLINLQENQQDQGMPLSQEELDGLLTTVCTNTSLNKPTAKSKLDAEIDTFLSTEELNELADTALEIKSLPVQEQAPLCEM